MKIQVAVLNQNVSLNTILQRAFPADEFEVLIFSDPDALDDALKKINPSAFLIGLSFPGDEHAVVSRLLSREDFENVPIIALEEAFCGKENSPSHKSLYSGHFRFPFDAGMLVEEVRRLVETQQPFLPLPEDPLAEEPASTKIPDDAGVDGRINRLAERLWERRKEQLKTEIIADIRKELRLGSGLDPEPEDP